jgi:hypothetical protein
MYNCERCGIVVTVGPDAYNPIVGEHVFCPVSCLQDFAKSEGLTLSTSDWKYYADKGYFQLPKTHPSLPQFLGPTRKPAASPDPEWLPEALGLMAAGRPHRVSYVRLEQMINLGYLTATGASLTKKGVEKCSK